MTAGTHEQRFGCFGVGVDLRLRDGRAYVVRPITPADKPLLRRGLRATSAESLRRRFLVPKPRLSAAELRYLTEVDLVDHYALVAVLRDAPGQLVAVGRWVRDREDPAAAEVAIIVGDEAQGQGVGTHLGTLLAEAARRRGIRRFTATMLGENRAAHALFSRLSDVLETQAAHGVEELVAELPL